MKKLVTLFLILALAVPAAAMASAALPDLSGLSFDELIQLKEKISLELWNRPEWQEVMVPPGVYAVGPDIPAGHWSIRPAEGCGPDNVIYGVATKDQGHDIDIMAGDFILECIGDPSSPYYSLEYQTSTDIDMEDGHFIRLDCTMIFTPYTGKPDLGFRR